MIYKHRIIFKRTVKQERYNPETGRTEPAVIRETMVPCEINPVTADLKVRLFGKMTVRAFKVILQRVYKGPFDSVTIDGKPYEVLSETNYETGGGFTALYVREIV